MRRNTAGVCYYVVGILGASNCRWKDALKIRDVGIERHRSED